MNGPRREAEDGTPPVGCNTGSKMPSTSCHQKGHGIRCPEGFRWELVPSALDNQQEFETAAPGKASTCNASCFTWTDLLYSLYPFTIAARPSRPRFPLKEITTLAIWYPLRPIMGKPTYPLIRGGDAELPSGPHPTIRGRQLMTASTDLSRLVDRLRLAHSSRDY